MKEQRILAVSVVKNSGKTTVIEKLIPALTARGLAVACIKHDGHRFEPDRPGSDSFRHLNAGAYGAAVFDGEKFQIVKRMPVEEHVLLALFPEADLVLLEGFKHSAWPKVEVVRSAVSDACVCREGLLAVVTDREDLAVRVPLFGLEETEKLAEYLIQTLW